MLNTLDLAFANVVIGYDVFFFKTPLVIPYSELYLYGKDSIGWFYTSPAKQVKLGKKETVCFIRSKCTCYAFSTYLVCDFI